MLREGKDANFLSKFAENFPHVRDCIQRLVMQEGSG